MGSSILRGLMYLTGLKARNERTEKVATIKRLTEETTDETNKLKMRVFEFRQHDDPLAALMRTLKPRKERRR